MKKYLPLLLLLLPLIGLMDASYITYNELAGITPSCTTNVFIDCGAVLKSSYAEIFGIPISMLGMLHYIIFFVVAGYTFLSKNRYAKYLLIILSTFAFIFSLYLVSVMVFVIGAICLYCLVSAAISFSLLPISVAVFPKERVYLFTKKIHLLYIYLLKRMFFLIDPEKVHVAMLSMGEMLGNLNLAKSFNKYFFEVKNAKLKQKLAGISFANPIGLAAGFDYEAKLTQVLPSIGFGFGSVGTITNMAYEGNPSPRLGRLPKSRSLMVNKGFKNEGAVEIAAKLEDMKFEYPVGISIGRTNSTKLKTQNESIDDIVEAYNEFEESSVYNAYYELNISCPNLKGNITFYPPKNLDDLLIAVDKLKLSRPVFIKMPIDRTNREFLAMLKVIDKHTPVGIIIGNLQRDRRDPALVQEEVKKFKRGNFSGKPTYRRSNELISLAYKHYKKRFVIVGCGGTFNAMDAYEKIKRGASLIQLITGMVYEGPQLASQINQGLLGLLKKDGHKHLRSAIGILNR